jgi:muramoyltetrapeptide carboxypeptidase
MIKFPKINKLSLISPNEASGIIVGGNLAVFTSLLGTRYLPDLKNKILFLEDIGESPYKIDRMFNQLRLNNVFNKVKGIILGRFEDCKEADEKKNTLTLEEVWSDYLGNIKIPAIHSFPHGHIKDMVTLPIGIRIRLNAAKGYLEFLESVVT